MDGPEVWRWIWLISGGLFTLGELSMPGSFFLAPFAVGAFVAALLAFIGASVAVGFAAFLLVSLATFLAFRPLARRLDETETESNIGANRLVGLEGVVTEALSSSAGQIGTVRIEREDWRAESADGAPLPAGTPVTILEIRGARAIVARSDGRASDTRPFPGPPLA